MARQANSSNDRFPAQAGWEDLAQAQSLFDQQLQAHWPSLLGELAQALNPAHAEIFARYPCRYYWSLTDSEWASDVMFDRRARLEEVYPRLLRYAVTTFNAVDVLRFLGQPVPASGKVPHLCRHEVSSNVKERREGVRIKHWLNGNSLKMYDKGSVLRVECLVREPGDLSPRPRHGYSLGSWRRPHRFPDAYGFDPRALMRSAASADAFFTPATVSSK